MIPIGFPCVNAGTPMFEYGMTPPYIIQDVNVFNLITYDYDTITLPVDDLAGNPRFIGEIIDIGAYEYQDYTTGNTIANNPKINFRIGNISESISNIY